MTFKYQEARDAGYSDDDITAYLQTTRPNFDFEGAKKEGYTNAQINEYLATSQKPEGEQEQQKKPEGIPVINAIKDFGKQAKRVQQQGAASLGGAIGGLPVEIANLLKGPENAEFEGIGKIASDFFEKIGWKGSHELGEILAEEFGVGEPQNALERVTRRTGEMSAFGNPALGIGQGILEELGLEPLPAAILSGILQLSPKAFADLKNGRAPKGTASKAEILSTEIRPAAEMEAAELAAERPKFAAEDVIQPRGDVFGTQEKAVEFLNKPIETSPVGLEVPIVEAEAKPLQGRVTKPAEFGESISKNGFTSEANEGRLTSKYVKDLAAEERLPIAENYRLAKQVTKNHNATFKPLADFVSDFKKEVELIPHRNTAEQFVHKQLETIQDLVGSPDRLLEANAAKLMAQADSMSKAVNYEEAFGGYKSRVKSLVREINQGVENSLKANGLANEAEIVANADKAYANFADRFLNDELAPFFEKRINDPESLAKKLRNPGEYRAYKNAVGETNPDLINAIDKALIEERLSPYFKNPSKVTGSDFKKDLDALKELVGPVKIKNVERVLRSKLAEHEKSAERSLMLQNQAGVRKSKEPGKGASPLKERLPTTEIKDPEDIAKRLKSPSDIKKLRAEFKSKGDKQLFDQIAEHKVEDIFREGGYGSKTLKGQDIVKIIDNPSNHPVLLELLGKESLDLIYKEAAIAGAKEISSANAKKLVKDLLKIGVNGSLGYGLISKILKTAIKTL